MVPEKKSNKQPYYNIVQIIWYDIVNRAGWEEKEDSDTTLGQCKTLGFLVRESEVSYTISSTVSENEFCGSITIPKNVVSEITYIKTKPDRIEEGVFKP